MDSATLVILAGQLLSLVVVIVTMKNRIDTLIKESTRQEKKLDKMQEVVNSYEPRIKVLEVVNR